MDKKTSKKFLKNRIGFRNIKTAIAVFLCLITQLIFPKICALNASIAAVVVMRETHYKSIETGIDRLFGTIIGGIFGYILLILAEYTTNYNNFMFAIVIPVLMVFCIYTCVFFKKNDSVVICCVVYLIIAMDGGNNNGNAIIFVGKRMLDTFIGVFFAILINKFLFPYKGKKGEVSKNL
ncbi:MAG: hypothetical protein GX765_02435 [Candidatus Moranbacteria bacterium]|nr:hypothetical protein [Candidatus Moranbacteria bacterium]